MYPRSSSSHFSFWYLIIFSFAAWSHWALGSSENFKFLKTSSSQINKHVTLPQQILRDTMNRISLSLCGLWITACDLYLEMSRFTKKSLNWINMNKNVVIVSVSVFQFQREKYLSHSWDLSSYVASLCLLRFCSGSTAVFLNSKRMGVVYIYCTSAGWEDKLVKSLYHMWTHAWKCDTWTNRETISQRNLPKIEHTIFFQENSLRYSWVTCGRRKVINASLSKD